jgi:hypothetical protein
METVVGWREWVSLPELGIPAMKAKIDTGAKTCALHAFSLEKFDVDGSDYVRFSVHPVRRKKSLVLVCEAPIKGSRLVRDSGGHTEERYVIETTINLDGLDIKTEFTLTNRDDMLFPMLLGRRAMQQSNLLVDVNQSYLHGRKKVEEVYG